VIARGDVRCPTCRAPVAKGARFFPFCSERCRWVDLGNWLEEKYRIPTEPDPAQSEREKGGADASGDEAEGEGERPS
jgi:hypothetical protein